MIKKSSCFLLACLLGFINIIHAQEFRMAAAMDSVTATGFYKIPISPALTSLAKADFSDIRIAGPGGGYVPYIIGGREQAKDTATGNILKIFSNVTEKTYTTITLGGDAAAWATGISLVMNNTSAERYAQVSGSNDNIKWYIIDDHVLLQRANGNNKGNYSQDISFPGNRYQYFKLKINNAHTDPLNIIGAKILRDGNSVIATPHMVANPAPILNQKDSSNHISYIALRNIAPYLVNEISLTVAGAAFYERNVTVYILPSDKDSGSLFNPVTSFTLSSKRPAVFIFAGQKAQGILLAIENKDNPPLKITNAATSQEQQYLVSWLEQGKKYTLLVGNEHATPPQYDLTKFADSIPAQPQALSYGPFSVIPHFAAAVAKPVTHSYWLWLIIVVSVTVLSLLTYRLMKDVKKEENKG